MAGILGDIIFTTMTVLARCPPLWSFAPSLRQPVGQIRAVEGQWDNRFCPPAGAGVSIISHPVSLSCRSIVHHSLIRPVPATSPPGLPHSQMFQWEDNVSVACPLLPSLCESLSSSGSTRPTVLYQTSIKISDIFGLQQKYNY